MPLASRNEDGTTAVYGDLAERLLLGLVFDPRVLDARAAPLGCGIYELPSGAVTAVVAVPPKADLAHAIWAALDSLKAAGCSLPSGSFATPNDVRFRLVAMSLARSPLPPVTAVSSCRSGRGRYTRYLRGHKS
ncbi:MAG: hypothetical protein C4317_07600 [Acidimicrobiia bacterium]